MSEDKDQYVPVEDPEALMKQIREAQKNHGRLMTPLTKKADALIEAVVETAKSDAVGAGAIKEFKEIARAKGVSVFLVYSDVRYPLPKSRRGPGITETMIQRGMRLRDDTVVPAVYRPLCWLAGDEWEEIPDELLHAASAQLEERRRFEKCKDLSNTDSRYISLYLHSVSRFCQLQEWILERTDDSNQRREMKERLDLLRGQWKALMSEANHLREFGLRRAKSADFMCDEAAKGAVECQELRADVRYWKKGCLASLLVLALALVAMFALVL